MEKQQTTIKKQQQQENRSEQARKYRQEILEQAIIRLGVHCILRRIWAHGQISTPL